MTLALTLLCAASASLPRLAAQTSATPAPSIQPKAARASASGTSAHGLTANFDAAAANGLVVMRKRAEELKIGGVAVLAYFEGEKATAWSSRMLIVGRMTDPQTGAAAGNEKGNNLLAIAYAKASEMAETLKNSGTAGRPPMTGEFGWEGGVIVRCGSGYLIAAFSGGQSADDVAVSRAGAAAVTAQIAP